MTRRLAIGLALALAEGGCSGSAAPTPPPSCTSSPQLIERALADAPGRVTLGSVPLSQCIARARSQGDLEAVGTVFASTADDLATRAKHNPTVALRLGYLVGATERGARHSAGVAAELVRRIELDGALRGADPAARSALDRGIRAGRAGG
jgi:hypothetical protein